jgi:AraC-like DNA-binding protein
MDVAFAFDRRVLNVLWIIQGSGCDQEITLAKIAALLNISRSRLQHLLRRDTGASFTWHLNRHRVAQAAMLLRGTSLLVKEIAARVGFRNTLALERHFKAVLECTPSEYRVRIEERA